LVDGHAGEQEFLARSAAVERPLTVR
jgi:hypothetical protein